MPSSGELNLSSSFSASASGIVADDRFASASVILQLRSFDNRCRYGITQPALLLLPEPHRIARLKRVSSPLTRVHKTPIAVSQLPMVLTPKHPKTSPLCRTARSIHPLPHGHQVPRVRRPSPACRKPAFPQCRACRRLPAQGGIGVSQARYSSGSVQLGMIRKRERCRRVLHCAM